MNDSWVPTASTIDEVDSLQTQQLAASGIHWGALAVPPATPISAGTLEISARPYAGYSALPSNR